MADHKFQMADGSFPIDRCTGENSVESAAKLAHHSKTYSFEQVKAHVMKAKNALGCPDSVLPDTWTQGSNAQPSYGLERRYFPLGQVQVESRAGQPQMIRGHTAVFNSLSGNLGFFREQIQPGAFSNTIKSDEIVALFNHDPNYPLGGNWDDRLTLREDEHGLYMEVKPTATSYANDLVTNIREGLVRKQSFGFQVVPGGDKWHTADDGAQIRTLHEVRLFDVSPVVFPAYQATDVQVRSWVAEAGLDFPELSAAVAKTFRGLDLGREERALLSEAVERLPILRSAGEGQASPAREANMVSPQAWWLNLHRLRRELAAKS